MPIPINDIGFDKLHEFGGHMYTVPANILLNAAKALNFSHATVVWNTKGVPVCVIFYDDNNSFLDTKDFKWMRKIEWYSSFNMTGKRELFVNTWSSIGSNSKRLANELANVLVKQNVPARATVLKGSSGVAIDWNYICDMMHSRRNES